MPVVIPDNSQWLADQIASLKLDTAALKAQQTTYVTDPSGQAWAIVGNIAFDQNGVATGLSGWGIATWTGSIWALTAGGISGAFAVTGLITSNYTAHNYDLVECDSASALTITSPSNAKDHAFIVWNANTGPVTVAAASGSIYGQGVSGVASIPLTTFGSYVELHADSGGNWIIVRGGQATEDSGWQTPSYVNSWANNVGNAYRLIGNRVYLRGSVTGGSTGTTIFTLPSGYRPAINEQWGGVTTAGTASPVIVTVVTGGAVSASFAAGSNPVLAGSFAID